MTNDSGWNAYASDFAAAHNVYLTHTDFSTGLSLTGNTPTLIIAGPNLGDGRFEPARLYETDVQVALRSRRGRERGR